MTTIRILRFSHDYLLNTGGLMVHLRGLNQALVENEEQGFEIHQSFLTGEAELSELLSRGSILRAGANYVQRDTPVNLHPIPVPSYGVGRPNMDSDESLGVFCDAFKTLLVRVRPHIVHSHFVKHRIPLATVEMAKANGIATVITHHEGEPDTQEKREILFKAARMADRLTAISRYSAKFLPGKVDFIGFFVDTKFWVVDRVKDSELVYWYRNWGISKKDLLIVYPARFIKRKNQMGLIQAFVSLFSDPEVAKLRPKLVLPGPTNEVNRDYERKLREFASSAGGAIIFPGDQPQEHLRALYSISDIVCYPARNEGAGRSHLEGMLLGCCAVVSSDSGVSEYITDHVNGLHFNPEHIGSLISCLRKVIIDGKFRAKLSFEGQATASELSLQKYAFGYATLYKELYKEFYSK